jgi:hypothetical protein
MTSHAVLAAHPQRIPFDEWWQIWQYTTALTVSDVDPSSLWLEVRHGQRHWIHESYFTHFDFEGGESPGTPDFVVAVSPRAVFYATDIVEPGDDGVLEFVDDTSLSISSGDKRVVFDPPHPPPLVRPEPVDIVATAIVNAQHLSEILNAARTPPLGLKFDGHGPAMWCTIGEGVVKFHSVWSRYGHGRITSIVAARTTGSVQFHTAISQIERLLSNASLDPDADVTFAADSPENGHACRVTGPGWTVVGQFIDAVVEEWGSKLRGVLATAGIDHEDDNGRAVEFMRGGIQVRAELHDVGRPVCRVSTLVADQVGSSEFLLAELNDLNQRFAGIKFWWEHSFIVAVADLDCSHLDDLPRVAAELAGVTTQLAPLVSAL